MRKVCFVGLRYKQPFLLLDFSLAYIKTFNQQILLILKKRIHPKNPRLRFFSYLLANDCR